MYGVPESSKVLSQLADRSGRFAVNSIAPEEIHGIEIYPGPATIPAEYASMTRDASCGLIAIWTRRDK